MKIPSYSLVTICLRVSPLAWLQSFHTVLTKGTVLLFFLAPEYSTIYAPKYAYTLSYVPEYVTSYAPSYAPTCLPAFAL